MAEQNSSKDNDERVTASKTQSFRSGSNFMQKKWLDKRFKCQQVNATEYELSQRHKAFLNRLEQAFMTRKALHEQISAHCGARVAHAKSVARRIREQNSHEALRNLVLIEERLRLAEKRRLTLLQKKKEKTVVLSQSLMKREARRQQAAQKIIGFFICCRQKLAAHMALKQLPSIDKLKTCTFNELTEIMNDKNTLKTAETVIDFLNLNEYLPSKDDASDGKQNTRIFLSMYIILAQDDIFLRSSASKGSSDQAAEMLKTEAKNLYDAFTIWLETRSKRPRSEICFSSELLKCWTRYHACFKSWKHCDATILIQMLIDQFLALNDAKAQIESEDDPVKRHAYMEGFKHNQAMLIVNIKKVGNFSRTEVLQKIREAKRIHEKSKRPQSNSLFVQKVQKDSRFRNWQYIHELVMGPEKMISYAEDTDFKKLENDQVFQVWIENQLDLIEQGFKVNVFMNIFKAIESILHQVLPDLSPTLKRDLENLIDLELLEQQCKLDRFDQQEWTTKVIQFLKTCCAPIRTNLVSSIPNGLELTNPQDFLISITRITFVCRILGLDLANFYILSSVPLLLSEAVSTEQRYFTEYYESGEIGLKDAEKWLSNEKESSECEKRTTLEIYAKAAVKLLADDKRMIPETFAFDKARLLTHRKEIEKLAQVYAILVHVQAMHNNGDQKTISLVRNLLYNLSEEKAQVQHQAIYSIISSPKTQISEQLILAIINKRDSIFSLFLQRLMNMIERQVFFSLRRGDENAIDMRLLRDEKLNDFLLNEKQVRESILQITKTFVYHWRVYKNWYRPMVEGNFNQPKVSK